MANKLKEINIRLDEILLEFFDVYDTLIQTQGALGNNMKDGFLSMSRARYSMGIKSVGVSQYNLQNMVASQTVATETNKCYSANSISISNKKDNSDEPFSTNFELVDPSKLQTDNQTDDGIPVETVGLRQRKVTDVKNENIVSASERQDSKKANKNDPLKWFGVLVSPSLRQSQTSFKSVIENVVSLANMKNKLLNLIGEYHECVIEKAAAEVNIKCNL